MKVHIVWIAMLSFLIVLATASSTTATITKAPNGSLHLSSGVTVLCPTDQTYNTRTLTFSYTFACGLGMRYNLNYNIDGNHSGPMPFVVDNPNEMHIVYSSKGQVQLPELGEGRHSLTITLHADTNGNGRSFDYADTINFWIDTTPPKITLQSPLNQTYTSTDVPLTYFLNDPKANITYSLDGKNTQLQLNGNMTLTNLALGMHTIDVSALDVGGNEMTSQTIEFTVEPAPTTTPSPEPTQLLSTLPLAVAIVILVTGICIAFIAFQKCRNNVTSFSAAFLRFLLGASWRGTLCHG